MDGEALAREYYRAIDDGDYRALADVLARTFVQHRPDRTLEGREAFVEFMEHHRPETDTTHEIEAVFTGERGVAIQGRLIRGSGDVWFRFVDVFAVGDGRLTSLRTYTHGS